MVRLAMSVSSNVMEQSRMSPDISLVFPHVLPHKSMCAHTDTQKNGGKWGITKPGIHCSDLGIKVKEGLVWRAQWLGKQLEGRNL